MKKLSDILNPIVENLMLEADTNSNTIVPPFSADGDRVGIALQKLDQIGEMANDIYNTISGLEDIDSEVDALLTNAYNSIDNLYTKIDEKYDIAPLDIEDEYDIEEDFDFYVDLELLDEKLSPDAPASEWIDDFIKSDAPQFKGKSKKERIKMALGAYYSAQQNEETDLEESFRPGYDMVPAPIGKDTYQSKGLRKLWGIQMRAGKWADTFVAMYADGKIGIVNDQGVNKYSTVDAFEKGFEKYRKSGNLDEAVNKEKVREKLASLKKAYQDIIDKKQDNHYTDKYDAQARIYHNRRLKEIPTEFKKLRAKLLGEDLELEESVNLPKIKELVSLALIDEKDVPATIAALKATQSDKALTPAQTKLLGNLAVMLTNVILGDTSALSSVKRAAKE